MKKLILPLIVTIVICGVLAYVAMQQQFAPSSANSRKPEPAVTPTPVQPQESEYIVELKELETPAVLHGFADMPAKERLELIAALKNSGDLSLDVRDYIQQAIRVRTLNPVVRNLMANCLFHSKVPDPDLHRLFMELYDNPNETATFRDFAVQFLARSYESTAEPQVVYDKLLDIATNDPTRIAGTAIVQLTHLEQQGQVTLASEVLDVMMKRLNDPNAPTSLKLSALGAVGRRGGGSVADINAIRKFAKSSTINDSLRRTAIATLGLTGDKKDIALIKPYLNHENPAVVMATKGALKRLASADQYKKLLEDAVAQSKIASTSPAMKSITHLASATATGLTFNALKKTLKAGTNQKGLGCTFHFINKTDKPITIKSLQTNCSCSLAKLKTRHYEPGDSGEIKITFELNNRQKLLLQQVYVQTDEPDAKPYLLEARIELPVYLTTNAGSISCRVGSKPRPMVIDIRAPHPDQPLSIARIVEPENNPFKVELVMIKEKRHWQLHITPLSTTQPSSASFTIVSDYPKEKPLYKIVRARVIK